MSMGGLCFSEETERMGGWPGSEVREREGLGRQEAGESFDWDIKLID